MIAKFLEIHGYTVVNQQELRSAIFNCIQYNHCAEDEIATTKYGVQYLVYARLITPDHRNPFVKTAWQIDHGTDIPRFITLIPHRAK